MSQFRCVRTASVAAALLFACFATAHAADVQGSADHPLLPRYEGSEIVKYETQAFSNFRLLTAVTPNYGGLDHNLPATTALEGQVTRITYRAPAGRASLEVFRNYTQALQSARFTTIFTCGQAACGGRNFNHSASPRHHYGSFGEYHAEQNYIAAKLTRPASDVYAAVYTVMNKAQGGADKDRAMVELDVIELRPMENRMVVVDAPQMQRDLPASGRVAVYGVLFDTDSDRMRDDSKPQLEEIAKLLRGSPNLRVLIVGHTDAQGTLAHNNDLSQRRARSISDALARDYMIDRARMTPVGVGPASPVGTNRTEQGRALNRRVEVVDLGT
jgi:outer membrane protein OmpA-like peptidoglycan-associated protein